MVRPPEIFSRSAHEITSQGHTHACSLQDCVKIAVHTHTHTHAHDSIEILLYSLLINIHFIEIVMAKFVPASDQELAEENHLPFDCSRNPLVLMITVAIEQLYNYIQLTKIAPSNKGIAQLAQHAFS